jgi:hypothetical protein
MSTAQNVANFKQKLPQIENIEEENFAQNENIEVENFAQNEIIEVNNNQVERALPVEIGTSKTVRIPKNSNSAVRNIETTDEFHETVQTTYEWNHGRNPLSSIENNQNQGQSQPRSNYLPHRANRGVNDKSYKAKAEEMSRQQLQDIWWLLYLEDHKWDVIPAVHFGIQMEFYDRVKVQRGQTIKIKLKQKNPKRNDYMWSGVVKAIVKAILLWSDTDMTEHMLSPTGKGRRSENRREDFSPKRKQCLKG